MIGRKNVVTLPTF